MSLHNITHNGIDYALQKIVNLTYRTENVYTTTGILNLMYICNEKLMYIASKIKVIYKNKSIPKVFDIRYINFA